MELAITLATQVFMMFLLAGFGYVCYRKQWINQEGSRQISSLLLNGVTPILIILSYQMEFDMKKLQTLCLTVVISAISFGISILVSQLLFQKDGVELVFASVFSNASFFAVPIVEATLGNEALLYLTAYLACFNVMVWTYGYSLMKQDSKRVSLKQLVTNPGVSGVLIGLLLFVCSVKLPPVIQTAMRNIANLNTPLAMLVFGIFFAQIEFKSIFEHRRIWLVSFVRLLVLPGCILAILFFVPSSYHTMKLTLVIASSAPVAITTALFAQKHERDYQLATKSIGHSSLFSIVTIPMLILLANQLW